MTRLEELYAICLTGEPTAAQQTELMALLAQPENEAEARRLFRENWNNDNLPETGLPEETLLSMRQTITAWDKDRTSLHTDQTVHRVHFLRTAWFRYAAALLIIFGAGYIAYRVYQPGIPVNKVVEHKSPIVTPGKNGAVLTLADGTKLVLDSLGNGIVANQQGAEVIMKDGSLTYNATKAVESKFNKMSTPRGRQFHLRLPDGTGVWLNASSSITYPTAFTAKERTVQIEGEVYFEVAKDRQKPFRVKVGDRFDVEVLGTHFNINSYSDEDAIRTTLLEGKVKISATEPETSNPKPETILSPGQQAMQTHQQLTIVNNVDISQVMAWKNGYFSFKNSDLRTVMRQLQRWYDIEVVYAGAVPVREFNGKIGRDLSFADVLNLLKKMDVKYSVQDGRTLVIVP